MNSLLVEKYRPVVLNDYIGTQELLDSSKNFIESGDIPHLLLYGKAGTGKTTLAKLLVKNIECDYLYVNASDENSVDSIRFKIKTFISAVGFNNLKVVILDEADYLTPNAQAALRNLMETFSKHSRFVMTCNYVERIIDPIQSRCQTFHVTIPTKAEAARKVKSILDSEKVKYTIDNIKIVVDNGYPDMRRTINMLQKSIVNNELVLDAKSVLQADFKQKVLNAIVNKNTVAQIRQIIADNSVRDFSELFTYLYENVEQISEQDADIVLLVLAQYQYQDALVVDKEINFAAMISALKEKI
jgi:DNA polymerase III delta prime subunit|tara:strand:+ start:1414 stop:2313 length:900 start_codon:yes stop_codon:yes gene_type:complete